nr:MAG TPA: hypothetical protein [Caudoviricetes sp.]
MHQTGKQAPAKSRHRSRTTAARSGCRTPEKEQRFYCSK